MRETDVQHPNTTATLSCEMSWRAFSANSGQLEAGSTTTASSILPITPPFALISAIVISATSLSEVSLIAIVPDSECRMPTLIVSAAWTGRPMVRQAPAIDAASVFLMKILRCM